MQASGGRQQFFFSPTFQCYTSPPFYRGLLLELDYVSWFVDQCKPEARNMIWRQLFVLLGAKPIQCTRLFFPVLHAWTESTTINLLAIELLYLAFATTLEAMPSLIKLTFEGGQAAGPAPSPFTGPSPLGPLLKQQMLPQAAQVAHSRTGALRAPAQATSGTGNTQASARAVRGAPQPVQIPTREVQSLQTRNAPVQVRKEPAQPAPKPQPEPEREEEVKPVSRVPDVKVLQQLIELQSWKAMLDEQTSAVKNTLISTLKLLPKFNADSFDETSMAATIDGWATDLANNIDMIQCMHTTVSFLKSNGVLKSAKRPRPPGDDSSPQKKRRR